MPAEEQVALSSPTPDKAPVELSLGGPQVPDRTTALPNPDAATVKLTSGNHQVLKHAPATSHGTYLDGGNQDVEELENYQKGGYHPTHLGDCFGPSDRYRVLHKLGYGGFGTVWLCRDTQKPGYVALKIIASDTNSEKIFDLSLAQLDQSAGAEYIATPLDHFLVDGPNGTHQCIVLPILGPCVSPRLWMRLGEDPASVLRKMACQATMALNYLHKNQIYFRPANVLVKLTSLDQLAEEELLSLLGRPKKRRVRTESSNYAEDLPAFSPKYLVLPADISVLGNEFMTDQICLIDFGESFSFSTPPEDLGIPDNYLPPEVLLEMPDAVGPTCDLWALGCTLFEIREQMQLFYMISDPDELISEMVRFFGKLPQELWEKWEARADFFDDDGKLLQEDEDWSLEVALSKPLEVFQMGKDNAKENKRSLETPEAEQKLLADLLYQLFQYDPRRRLAAEEVLKHGWFKM
ncbi:hypothetical protein ACHAPT_010965 [Fusarium lateritium]